MFWSLAACLTGLAAAPTVSVQLATNSFLAEPDAVRIVVHDADSASFAPSGQDSFLQGLPDVAILPARVAFI